MGGLPIQSEWRKEAEKRLRDQSVNVAEYPSKTFRVQFFKTIGHVYWDRLIESTKHQQLDDFELAGRLGLSQASESRWTTGAKPPGADKFFAVVLLVLKRELKDLDLGSQNAILFHAVQRQHQALAEKYHEPASCELDQFVFKSVLRVMSVPAVNDLAPNAGKSKAEKRKALTEAVAALNKVLNRDFNAEAAGRNSIVGAARKVEPEELDEWLACWGVPYTLFAMGCTRTWGIEHV